MDTEPRELASSPCQAPPGYWGEDEPVKAADVLGKATPVPPRSGRKCLLWLLLLIGSAVVGTTVIVFLISQRPCVTRENFEKIDPGMTMAEVEALLGVPTGNPKQEVYISFLYTRPMPEPRVSDMAELNARLAVMQTEEWVGEEFAIRVYFDSSGRVFTAMGWVCGTRETFLKRVRRLSGGNIVARGRTDGDANFVASLTDY